MLHRSYYKLFLVTIGGNKTQQQQTDEVTTVFKTFRSKYMRSQHLNKLRLDQKWNITTKLCQQTPVTCYFTYVPGRSSRIPCAVGPRHALVAPRT